MTEFQDKYDVLNTQYQESEAKCKYLEEKIQELQK